MNLLFVLPKIVKIQKDGFETLLLKIGGQLALSKGRIRIEGHTDNTKIAFSERFMSKDSAGLDVRSEPNKSPTGASSEP